jgi:hypothetical protein
MLICGNSIFQKWRSKIIICEVSGICDFRRIHKILIMNYTKSNRIVINNNEISYAISVIFHRVYCVRTNNRTERFNHWGQLPHTRDGNQTQFNRFDSRIKCDYDLHLLTDLRGKGNFDVTSSIHFSHHIIGL